MKNILTLILILFTHFTLQAQNLFITGQVSDSTNNKPISNANIILHLDKSKDSIVSPTDKSGRFNIAISKNGEYDLSIQHVGYKKYTQKVRVQNRSVDLKVIQLIPVLVQMKSVDIVGEIPPVVQKQDTAEYNADAFKINKDANAEDLIQKMPGITTQDGKTQAQGEEVKKVLVDGKPFFGDDPNAVLRNVPAEIIEKIQVFDQQSEQSQFTGFDDGNASKTINIVTRQRFREGTFGRLNAGYGTEERYMAGGNINYFDKDQRITLLAQNNNINQQNFAMEDLVGVMSDFGGRRMGGGGGRPMGGGGGNVVVFSGGGGGFREGGASTFLVDARDGLTRTNAAGLNYSNKFSDNLELNGSYFFNFTNNNAIKNTNRDYLFSTTQTQNYNENNLSNSKNTNHRFNSRLEYKIDSMNSILFQPRFSLQYNKGNSNTLGSTVTNGNLQNKLSNLFNTDLTGLNTSINLLFRHRFETRGRTLSLNVSGSYLKNDGDNNLYSEVTYYDKISESDTVDQISKLLKNSKSGSTNLTYTEPLFENDMLQFGFSYSYSKEESDMNTFNYSYETGSYSKQNIPLSNVYDKTYITQNGNVGYRYQNNEINLNATFSYNRAQLKNDKVYPFIDHTNKIFNSFLPSLNFRYNISKDQNLDLHYRTNNNVPSVEQLQNVLNNSDPLQLSIGNSDLVQDYRHSLNLRYSKVNTASLTSFFILLNGTLTEDYIGSNTIYAYKDTTVLNNILLKKGAQITYPVNLSGYGSVRSFMTFGFPFALISSNLNLNVDASYTRRPSQINSLENIQNSLQAGGGLVISSNINEDINFMISGRSSFNSYKNSIQKSSNRNYWSHNLRSRFYWMFFAGFNIQSEFEYSYNGGVTTIDNRNTYLLNLSFGKKFLANNQAEIKLYIFDVLDKNKKNTNNVNDYYVENISTNVIGRYFMLSFNYRLSAF